MILNNSPTVYNTGHVIGQFFKSRCDLYAYIPIPKCASKWTTKFLYDGLNWEVSTRSDKLAELSLKKFTILREPLDRWISGMCQYLVTYHPKTLLNARELIEFIFKRVDFDPHTTPQINYLNDLNSEDLVYFKFDNDLEKNVKSYIKYETGQEYGEPVFRNDMIEGSYKSYASDIDHSRYYGAIGWRREKLKILLESNDDWKNSVLKYYKDDIDLYNSVQFYGK